MTTNIRLIEYRVRLLGLLAFLAVCSASAANSAVRADQALSSPEVFDWGFYVTRHPDLAKAGITDATAATEHWLNNGIYEGRQSAPWFHSAQYLEANPDLRRVFGSDYVAATQHYLSHGIREGRQGAPFDRDVFDWQFYLAQNPEVAHAGYSTESGARAHWAQYGLAKGRQAMWGFHSRQYLEQNPDLQPVFGSNYAQALIHFQRYGHRKGRVGTAARIPLQRIGMYYSVWHAPASSAQKYIAEGGAQPLNLNDIVTQRFKGKRSSDVLASTGLLDHAIWFHYQHTPALGYYCMYRRRPGEYGYAPGGTPLRDCPEAQAVARRHADQLVGAGIDYVVVDSTNLASFDSVVDVLGLRPIEVLFEEWREYRGEGHPTPQIAVWALIPTGATLYADYLRLMNDPANDGLVMRDPHTGKKVMFVVDRLDAVPDPTIMQNIACNWDGTRCRNDVLAVRMWAHGLQREQAGGKWDFMSPCVRGPDQFVTTILPQQGCNQNFTAGSPIGSALAVSASYQLDYASVPFGASGTRNGLTLKVMFDRAFALRPDYLLINGWNEFVAQPQNPQPRDPAALSLGLEADRSGGIDGTSLWVDDFGAGFSRDIEPTLEKGSKLYDVMSSCLRVYRARSTSCDNSNESCCQRGPQDLIPVYSLKTVSGNYTLTTSSAEVRSFQAKGFREICSRSSWSTSFCQKADEPELDASPFYTSGLPLEKYLYRCRIDVRSFFSDDPRCEGYVTEAGLGYISSRPTSEFPRALLRCFNPITLRHSHSLRGFCPAPTRLGKMIGYVR